MLDIFLDMDGVLVNWVKGLCQLYNISPFDERVFDLICTNKDLEGSVFGTDTDIREAVNRAGYDFWINLEELPWSRSLIALCERYGNITFLTSPSTFHAGAHAKLDYVWSHFNSDQIILTSLKGFCAAPNRILIDDMEKNITSWEKNGGCAFPWPAPYKLLTEPELLASTFSDLDSYLQKHANRENSVAY